MQHFYDIPVTPRKQQKERCELKRFISPGLSEWSGYDNYLIHTLEDEQTLHKLPHSVDLVCGREYIYVISKGAKDTLFIYTRNMKQVAAFEFERVRGLTGDAKTVYLLSGHQIISLEWKKKRRRSAELDVSNFDSIYLAKHLVLGGKARLLFLTTDTWQTCEFKFSKDPKSNNIHGETVVDIAGKWDKLLVLLKSGKILQIEDGEMTHWVEHSSTYTRISADESVYAYGDNQLELTEDFSPKVLRVFKVKGARDGILFNDRHVQIGQDVIDVKGTRDVCVIADYAAILASDTLVYRNMSFFTDASHLDAINVSGRVLFLLAGKTLELVEYTEAGLKLILKEELDSPALFCRLLTNPLTFVIGYKDKIQWKLVSSETKTYTLPVEVEQTQIDSTRRFIYVLHGNTLKVVNYQSRQVERQLILWKGRLTTKAKDKEEIKSFALSQCGYYIALETASGVQVFKISGKLIKQYSFQGRVQWETPDTLQIIGKDFVEVLVDDEIVKDINQALEMLVRRGLIPLEGVLDELVEEPVEIIEPAEEEVVEVASESSTKENMPEGKADKETPISTPKKWQKGTKISLHFDQDWYKPLENIFSPPSIKPTTKERREQLKDFLFNAEAIQASEEEFEIVSPPIVEEVSPLSQTEVEVVQDINSYCQERYKQSMARLTRRQKMQEIVIGQVKQAISEEVDDDSLVFLFERMGDILLSRGLMRRVDLSRFM